MVFNIFKNKKEAIIEESLNRYKKHLDKDKDLNICITSNKKFYFPDIERFDKRKLIFRLGIKDKDKVKYKIGQVIRVDFISKTGLYTTKVSIINKSVDEFSTYYTGKITSPIEKNQRRNYYRISVHKEISYVLLPNKLKSYNGIAKDISVGGMLMESLNFIPEDRQIKLFFELNKKMYRVKGSIVKSREHRESDKYLHHIRFDDLGYKEKNELSKFVFNEQKKKLRRRVGTL